MQAYDPVYFCLDAAGNIIISDNSAHRIQIFSKEGNFIQTIEGYGPGKFDLPEGIALTEQLSLVVVSHNFKFTFQIFSCQ